MKNDYILVGSETDAIALARPDGSPISKEEFIAITNLINNNSPELIRFEDDGYYERMVVIKAKNYVTKCGDKISIKGSAFRDAKKEEILKVMLKTVLYGFLEDDNFDYLSVYHKYVKKALNITDISGWVTKKSITETLLQANDTSKKKVLEAIGDRTIQVGNKVYLFNDVDGEKQTVVKGELIFFKKTGKPRMEPNRILRVQEDFTGSYDKFHYVERVFKTMKIFAPIIDMDKILNYNLKKNRELLDGI